MTLPLPANWSSGQLFNATAENNVAAVINGLGDGSIPIPKRVNASSASTLTLSTAYNTYVYTGSTTSTWTLPAVSGHTGTVFWLINRGTGVVTLQRAGSDHLYYKASVTSFVLSVFHSLVLLDDGTYWLVIS